MSLSRHTTYNLLGQVLPLAVSLLTIPIYLRLIGEARFGVLALIWLFFGYMGLFDLGLGQAIAGQLARLRSESRAQQAQALCTALLISLGLGIVGALIALPLGGWFFGQHASLDAGLRAELLAALPWAVALVPLTTIVSVMNGALVARSAFGELGLISAAGSLLATLAPMAVAAMHHGLLPALVAAVVGVRLIMGLWMLWRCGCHYAARGFLPFDRKIAAQLLRFGGWATLSATVGPFLVVVDRFAIGAQLGSQAVSHYVIPFQLAERITLFSSALNQALFPRLSSAVSEDEQRRLTMVSLRTLAVWTPLPLAAALLLAGPFLSWWLSPEFGEGSSDVARILIFAYWINSLAVAPFTKLFATARSDLVAKCHLFELLPYLLLLYVSLKYWGIVGAAAAFAARVTVDFLLLSHFAGTLAPTLRVAIIPVVLLGGILGVTLSSDLPVMQWPLALCILLILFGWFATQLRNVSDRSPMDSYP